MLHNPLRLDPTRTISLRRSFNQSLSTLFNQLTREIRQLILDEDAFGLKRELMLSLNGDYASTYNIFCATGKGGGIDPTCKTIGPKSFIGTIESNRQHIEIKGTGEDGTNESRLIVTAYKKESEKTWLDIGGRKDTVYATFDINYQDKSVYLNRIDALVTRKGYGIEVVRAMMEEFKNRDIYHMTSYVQYTDQESQSMMRKLGGKEGKETEHGRYWTFDLKDITHNKRWKYQTQSQAVDQFDTWVSGKIDSLILSAQEVAKWKKYIEKGFQKGANRAFDDTKKGKADFQAVLRASGFVEDRREQFVRQSLSRATAAEKLKLLDERALAEVVSMTRDLKSKARRVLTDGLVKGQSPTQIAKALSTLLNISKGRAQTIANTELVRAHAEGQLEAMEQLGVANVGIAVEWSTAFNPCKVCQPLKGIVLSLPEARGLLPRHPNCRCAWLPAGVGEDKTTQKRGKYKIDKAIAQSQKRSLSSDDWGPSKEISRKRPIVNVSCACSDGLTVFAKLLEQVGETK